MGLIEADVSQIAPQFASDRPMLQPVGEVLPRFISSGETPRSIRVVPEPDIRTLRRLRAEQ